MSFLPRRRPSPAMLVALLALVLAMTGTAAAAVLITSPDQLADNVVTEPKLATDAVTGRALNEPSVGPSHILDRAVTNSKLTTGAVDARTITGNAVTASKLAEGAVASRHLVNPVFSASINADGTGDRFVGVDRSQTRRISDGRYEVTFERSVVNCVVVGQIRDRTPRPGLTDTIKVSDPAPTRPNTVTVFTESAAVSEGVPGQSPILSVSVSRPFDLIAAC